jgi:hypothetical protein
LAKKAEEGRREGKQIETRERRERDERKMREVEKWESFAHSF